MNGYITEKQERKRDTVAFAASLLSLYPRRTVLIMIAFIAAGLMEGIGVTSMLPLLTLLIEDGMAAGPVNDIIGNALRLIGLTPDVGTILALIVLLLSAKAAVTLAAMKRAGNITANIGRDLRLRLLRALLGARWQHFKTLAVGNAANAIGTEAQRATGAFLNLAKSVADTSLVAVYLFLALFISWKITIGAIVAGLAIMWGLRAAVGMAKTAGQQQTTLLSAILTQVTDALAGVKAVKAMGREAHFESVLAADITGLARAQEKEFMALQILTVAREPLVALILAAGMYVAVTYMGMSLPALLVLAFMFFRVVTKLAVIQASYQRVVSLESAYWSLLDSIEGAKAQKEDTGTGTNPPPPLAQGIRFENVSFKHTDGDTPVLQNIDITIAAHAFTVIAGPSGAGKTTLVDILAGLYTPASGRVLVDSEDLSRISLPQWRRRIGYLPQECPLFHDTILHNITLGDPAISREDAAAALKKAGALPFLSELPEGMDTIVGERGARFSGGQRQRIALARALAAGPSLLILDEPTSAMDAGTERQIMETIRTLSRDITVIAITHNPAVIEYADKVFRIEGGKIAAQSNGAQ